MPRIGSLHVDGRYIYYQRLCGVENKLHQRFGVVERAALRRPMGSQLDERWALPIV